MYKVEEINDKQTWETFLCKVDFYPFFQSWNWGEVQKVLGFNVQRIGIFNNKNRLQGVCLIVEVHARRGYYFHLRHGPVLLSYSDDILHFLFSFIETQARMQSVSFLRASPLIPWKTAEGYFKSNQFIAAPIHNMDAEVCWILDITKSEETLLSDMRKTHRYLIRKSQTMNMKLIRTKNSNDIERFLPLYSKLSKRKHFVPHRGVKEEFAIFSKDNQEELYLVEYENKIIAGALIAYVGNMAMYRHSALDKNYHHIPASYRIQWEAIREAKKRGLQLYNFWGIAPSNDQNHPWQGLTLFKTGFGGEKKEFVHAHDLPLSPWYWKNYAIDFLTKIRKGY